MYSKGSEKKRKIVQRSQEDVSTLTPADPDASSVLLKFFYFILFFFLFLKNRAMEGREEGGRGRLVFLIFEAVFKFVR